ncbi:MAG: CBS domain-containing protein [Methanomassiliicoccales archaeon]|nr:CBS domain-containing protein [Methanomassiliicoccales archaeon]
MPQSEKRFSDVLVGDVHDRMVLKPSQVTEGATIEEVIDQMLANPVSRKVYIVDDHGSYIGTVSIETILRLMGYRVGVREGGGLSFYRFLRDTLKENVREIMVKGRTVSEGDKLTEAMRIMIEDHLNDLPVVDEEGRLIGELVSLELLLEGKRMFEPKKWSPPIQ